MPYRLVQAGRNGSAAGATRSRGGLSGGPVERLGVKVPGGLEGARGSNLVDWERVQHPSIL